MIPRKLGKTKIVQRQESGHTFHKYSTLEQNYWESTVDPILRETMNRRIFITRKNLWEFEKYGLSIIAYRFQRRIICHGLSQCVTSRVQLDIGSRELSLLNVNYLRVKTFTQ